MNHAATSPDTLTELEELESELAAAEYELDETACGQGETVYLEAEIAGLKGAIAWEKAHEKAEGTMAELSVFERYRRIRSST